MKYPYLQKNNFKDGLSNTFSRSNLLFALGAISFLFLNIIYLDYSVQFIGLGKNLEHLNHELSVRRSANTKLQNEINRLSNLSRIEKYATDSCAMTLADLNECVVLVYERKTVQESASDDNMLEKTWYAMKTRATNIMFPSDQLVESF
jgi:hypothetical protein